MRTFLTLFVCTFLVSCAPDGQHTQPMEPAPDQPPGPVIGNPEPPAPPGPVIGTPAGASGDYFILIQPPQPAFTVISVRPVSGQSFPEELERWNPSNGQLRDNFTIDWRATARCGSGLSQVRISGPGGSLSQNFDDGPQIIDGTAAYQSFDIDAADQVCFSWLESIIQACDGDLLPPDCMAAQTHTFTFGPGNPLPGSTPVTVSSTCVSGDTVNPATIIPRLELRCSRADL